LFFLMFITVLPLTISADDLRVIKLYVDIAFAVNPDFKSHTGGIMTLGKGSIQGISWKYKLNAQSSTEAALVLVRHYTRDSTA